MDDYFVLTSNKNTQGKNSLKYFMWLLGIGKNQVSFNVNEKSGNFASHQGNINKLVDSVAY